MHLKWAPAAYSICLLASNTARLLTAKSNSGSNAGPKHAEAAVAATVKRSGKEFGYTDAGRRFAVVGDRTGIKAGRPRAARLGPPTHPRVRLLVIRTHLTENHCDWAFSIAVERTF